MGLLLLKFLNVHRRSKAFTFLSTGHSVQICINLKWQTKENMLIVIKVFKHVQEKQSESLSKTCTITIYGEGAASLSKPHVYSFRAAAREKWVTF